MSNGRDELRWSPRVPKRKLRRLYESHAQGLLDEDLLEDIGWTLVLRCQDILTIDQAKRGEVSCPRCAKQGSQTVIARVLTTSGDPRDEVITCPECGWQVTWGEYALSYKRKQLNAGGATRSFASYVQAYKAARSAQAKMLAIDRLIHEFHYSARVRPDQPTRPVGVNLIQGKLGSVIEFLDELSGYPGQRPEMADIRERWEQNLERYRNIDWGSIVAEQRAQRAASQGHTQEASGEANTARDRVESEK